VAVAVATGARCCVVVGAADIGGITAVTVATGKCCGDCDASTGLPHEVVLV